MRIPYLILPVLCYLLLHCSSDQETEEAAEPQLKITTYTFERYSPSCKGDSSLCASFSVSYPMLTQGDDPQVVQQINQAVQHEAKRALWVGDPDQDVSGRSLDDISAQFFTDYQRVQEETDMQPMPWAVEAVGELIYQSETIITVAMSSYQFTGGAHPNTYTAFLNFDRQTGQLLKWPDILVDSTAFAHLAEQQFRKARQIGSNTALDKAGFFWGGAFHPPSNFSLEENGLRLFYNNYEIAPYALGPTDFVITYSQLSDVVKPKFIAQADSTRD